MRNILLVLIAIGGFYSLSFLTKSPEKLMVHSVDSVNEANYKDLKNQVRNLKLYSKLDINDLEATVDNLVVEKTTFVHPKVSSFYFNSYQWIYLAAFLFGGCMMYSFRKKTIEKKAKESHFANETSDESQIIYLCDEKLNIMWQSYGANQLNLNSEQFEEMIGHSYLIKPYDVRGSNYLVKFHQINDGKKKCSYLFNLLPFSSYKDIESNSNIRPAHQGTQEV